MFASGSHTTGAYTLAILQDAIDVLFRKIQYQCNIVQCFAELPLQVFTGCDLCLHSRMQ